MMLQLPFTFSASVLSHACAEILTKDNMAHYLTACAKEVCMILRVTIKTIEEACACFVEPNEWDS